MRSVRLIENRLLNKNYYRIHIPHYIYKMNSKSRIPSVIAQVSVIKSHYELIHNSSL